MARLAALVESTKVNIFVARVTSVESKACELLRSIRLFTVTVFTLGYFVRARQRIPGLRVIEALRCPFPIIGVVALLAIRSQSPLVLILVAACASFRKS